jgi:predicted nucleic acid-binding protein
LPTLFPILNESSQHAKHVKAVEFLKQFDTDDQVIISSQVLSEYYYSALLKTKISDEDIQESASQLVSSIEVAPVTEKIVIDSQHTMAAIGKHFGVHYATVNRAVKDFEKTEGE